MKITCIDFETANPFWGSICSTGIAVIEDGKVTQTLTELIKPHPEHGVFNRDNIRVHGIKPDMVSDAPEFSAFYPKIKPLIENNIIAAHNTSFDVDCIRDVLTIYNIPIPSFEHICTCELAERAFPGLESYRLKTVSKHLGFKFKHHDAGEDALAAANVIIKAMEKTGISDIRKLAESLGVEIRTVRAADIYELSSIRQQRKREQRVDARGITAENTEFDPAHPLLNKEIVFTGQFANGMHRREAMQQAANTGAKLINYVRYATDFLVQGAKDRDKEGSKARKAKKLMEAGAKIKILSEEEFLSLLQNGAK
jgi:DNA polymerase-3 subunit epsilon